MKNIIAITAILFTMLAMQACDKGSNSPALFYSMNAVVGTDSFNADGPSKAYINGTASGGIEYTDLWGKASNGKVINIRLISSPGVPLPRGASIPVNNGQVLVYYYPRGFDSSFIYGVYGSVVLSAVSPSYIGTFNFTCADSTQVTNGTFNIKAP